MIINGGTKLKGEIEISASKNAVLPIMAASLLTDEEILLHQVPNIKDVKITNRLMAELGRKVEVKENTVRYYGEINNTHPSYELVKQMRASFLIMGPLLARKGQVRLSLPGGCAIGNRPIDLHLKGLQTLGAKIDFSAGDVIASAKKLIGNHIYLDFPSVGATENIIMAATMAEGITYIENAALEPEIVDLANFINHMGGKITGAGTNVIKIKGVKQLNSANYTPIPDRIEAGTFMIMAAASKGELIIKNIIAEHLKAITAKLIESGAEVREEKNKIWVQGSERIQPIYIKTLPYPGFPTDMQAQFMAYLSCAEGSSIISETVFENRYMHVQELIRMGADIRIEGRTAIIRGVNQLSGAHTKATDLRAGAALVTAAISAEGISVISDCEHISRGYENFVAKLNSLGGKLKINQ